LRHARSLERGEEPLDVPQVGKRLLARPAEVLEVAALHHEVDPQLVHLGGERLHFDETVRVIPGQAWLQVRRIMTVCDKSEPDGRN